MCIGEWTGAGKNWWRSWAGQDRNYYHKKAMFIGEWTGVGKNWWRSWAGQDRQGARKGGDEDKEKRNIEWLNFVINQQDTIFFNWKVKNKSNYLTSVF